MLNKLRDLLLQTMVERKRGLCVTFTGGLGAQILSAAIYYYYIERGFNVVADFSYFENEHRIATEGEAGELSYWKWELDSYGIHMDSFKISDNKLNSLYPTLHDGPLKLSLAINALRIGEIRSYYDFSCSDFISQSYRESVMRGEKYLCVHLRRGDYLNVASHIVSSDGLDTTAVKFSNIINRVLIVSDSKIEDGEFSKIRASYGARVCILDGDNDPNLTHSLMRNAAILICSNSQFSLSAGMLSSGLKIIPKKWFGNRFSSLNSVIDGASDFAILNC